MFKDKFQELIDKNTMLLDADMRAATTNVVFVDEDLIYFMNPQDNKDVDDDGDNWVTFKSKETRKRRL